MYACHVAVRIGDRSVVSDDPWVGGARQRRRVGAWAVEIVLVDDGLDGHSVEVDGGSAVERCQVCVGECNSAVTLDIGM